MYTMLVAAHSGWRQLVILVLAVAIIRAIYGWIRGSDWGIWDTRLGLATVIAIDIQLILGLVVWIMGQHWQGYNSLAAWEHPVTMILAVVAAHVTSTRVKKGADSAAMFRTAAIGFGITALILALGIARITHLI